MMTDVPAKQRFALIAVVLGLVNKDLTIVVENLRKLDFLPNDGSDPVPIVNALEEVII
jgi:hypothetical protein